MFDKELKIKMKVKLFIQYIVAGPQVSAISENEKHTVVTCLDCRYFQSSLICQSCF